MNKMIKLPLFLGCVGAICGGVLAATNALTADKIASDEALRANEAYIEHFSTLATTKQEEVSETLTKAGVTEKLYVYDSSETYLGSVYTCSVTGYAGKSSPIKFSVSFKDGDYNHFVSLGHSESSVGAAFMTWLSGDVNGDKLRDIDNSGTGSSVSYKAVKTAVSACYSDYQLDYKSMK